MKTTKFIRVSVEERLPEIKDDSVIVEFENGELSSVHRQDWFKDITAGLDENGAQLYSQHYTIYKNPKVLFWLEEVEDKASEMLEMLNYISNETDQICNDSGMGYIVDYSDMDKLRKLIKEATVS